MGSPPHTAFTAVPLNLYYFSLKKRGDNKSFNSGKISNPVQNGSFFMQLMTLNKLYSMIKEYYLINALCKISTNLMFPHVKFSIKHDMRELFLKSCYLRIHCFLLILLYRLSIGVCVVMIHTEILLIFRKFKRPTV